MKKSQGFCWVLLVFAVSFLVAFPAWAKDGGEERIVPVIEWRCYACQARYFTFDPDDIGGASKSDHKMTNYQQQNWMLLSDAGKSVPKCSKSPDGAHFFEKKGQFNTSPYIIHERRNDYIVLKNGGTVKAKFEQWQCKLCGMNGYDFDGDDLDMVGDFNPTKEMNVFNMASGSRIKDCGFKAANGAVYRYHVGMQQGSVGSARSYDIAKNFSRIWYSD